MYPNIGYYYKSIDDCGCFGSLIQINPYLTFLKNIVMFSVSIWIWKNSELESKSTLVKFLIVCIFGCITFFVNAFELRSLNKEQAHRLTNKSIVNTFLGQYLNKQNPENVIFVFSPLCSHCKSVAKVLAKAKVRVIGLYPDVIKANNLPKFVRETQLNFKILPVRTDSLMKYTVGFPTIFVIEKGIVKRVLNNY